MKNDMKIGNKLNKLRVKKNLSQAMLADRVGVCQSSYQAWENDQSLPSAKSFVLLAIALEVDVLELIPDDLRNLLPNTNIILTPQSVYEETINSQKLTISLLQQRIAILTEENVQQR